MEKDAKGTPASASLPRTNDGVPSYVSLNLFDFIYFIQETCKVLSYIGPVLAYDLAMNCSIC
jgi:hypothetical protein